MSYYCQPCDRGFGSYHSLNQHLNNSSFHQQYYESSSEEEPEFECDACTHSFYSSISREQHHAAAHSDRYCSPCKRMFQNANNLMQHQHSRAHVGVGMKCPFCSNNYATASGVIIHLESGRCPSGCTRQRMNEEIRRLDRNHVITTRLLEYPSSSNPSNIATERSWNGYAYQCYLCARQTATLSALNAHLKSPAHEQNWYHCPKASCGQEFKLLSGLVQHVESERCGVMRFGQVQEGARRGIDSMVGRMIGY